MDSSTAQVGGKYVWIAAFGTSTVVVAITTALSLFILWADVELLKLMKAISNYDKGHVLEIIDCISSAGLMVGCFGVNISYKCATKNKAYQLRYIIKSYLGWGFGMIVLYLLSAASVFAYSDFKQEFTPGFNVDNYTNNVTIQDEIDNIQSALNCCGNQNYTEWFGVEFSATVKSSETAIPKSCCSKPTNSCIHEVPVGDEQQLTAHELGCLDAASKHYARILKRMAVLMVAAALTEIIVVILFCVQACRLKKQPMGERKTLINKQGSEKPNVSHGKSKRTRK